MLIRVICGSSPSMFCMLTQTREDAKDRSPSLTKPQRSGGKLLCKRGRVTCCKDMRTTEYTKRHGKAKLPFRVFSCIPWLIKSHDERFQASSSRSTASKFLPSSISRLAPPPVLMCETLSANPSCWIAAALSPPPMMLMLSPSAIA
jgi:hypothetical protein